MVQAVGIHRARRTRSARGWLALGMVSVLPHMAYAQSYAPPAAPPVRKSVDENGVDLITGQFEQTVSTVSAGPDEGGVSYTLAMDGASITESDSARIYVKGYSDYTVVIGGSSVKFFRSTTPPNAFSEVEITGSSLSFDSATTRFTFTDRYGTRYIFQQSQNLAPNGEGPDGYDMGPLVEIIEPSGRKRTITYSRGFKPSGTGSTVAYRRVQSVESNTGWMAKPEYADDTIATLALLPDWQRAVKVTAFDNTIVGCAPSANHCTMPSGYTWPTVTLVPSGVGYSDLTHANGVQEEVFDGSGGFTTGRRWEGEGPYYTYAIFTAGKVSSAAGLDGVTTNYSYADASGVRTVTRTMPTGSETYKFDIAGKLLKEHTNGTGNKTEYLYDASKRLTRTTYPELNYDEITYDARGNITTLRKVAKPGSGLADIVTSASFDATCSNVITCNKPNSVTDAKGNVIDLTYDPVHGGILTMTAPAATVGGVRPQTRYSYTLTGGIYMLTGVSTCQTLASCAGAADEAKKTIAYNAKNMPSSITTAAGNGSVSSTVAYSYDTIGNVLTIDGPLAGTSDTARFRYNNGRQQIGTIGADPDGAGTRKHAAQRTTLDAKGRIAVQETGTVNSQSDGDWAAFSAITAVTSSYDAKGNKIKEAASGTAGDISVTQYGYDSSNRLSCAAQRMSPATWTALPVSACVSATTGSFGPDRITRNTYDAADRVTKIEAAVGTSEAADEVQTSYTANGQIDYVIDAENNRTSYIYDGYDRQTQRRYPSTVKGANASNASDYETLTYDALGSVIQRRLRDATTITYTYDNLGRMTTKDLPGSEPDITYAYDLVGQAVSVTQGTHTLSFSHNALGHLTSQTGPLGTIGYSYDATGRRLTMVYPGGGLTINYDYDVGGNLTAIRENGAVAGAAVLASYAFDNVGRPTSVTFGNGSVQSFGYDAASRLSTVTNDLSATTYDLTQAFSYNPAGQLASVIRSNDAYAWQAHYNVDRPYTIDGLSRLVNAGGVTFGYDGRGNLASSGSSSYTYSAENLLKTAPSGVTLAYDPLSRLHQTAATETTRFLYDGSDLIGEFDGSSNLLRRYVHGPGDDNPIVWYEGSAINGTTRRFLMGDERGSVVSVTDTAGATVAINSYDQHGIPGSSNMGRFGYTGQTWLPELGMWYYKARMYSPTLGRFLQTDPIGYADGLNWYNYVSGDPINSSDPSGLCPGCRDGDDDPGIVVTGSLLPPGPVRMPTIPLSFLAYPAMSMNLLSVYGRPRPPAVGQGAKPKPLRLIIDKSCANTTIVNDPAAQRLMQEALGRSTDSSLANGREEWAFWGADAFGGGYSYGDLFTDHLTTQVDVARRQRGHIRSWFSGHYKQSYYFHTHPNSRTGSSVSGDDIAAAKQLGATAIAIDRLGRVTCGK